MARYTISLLALALAACSLGDDPKPDLCLPAEVPDLTGPTLLHGNVLGTIMGATTPELRGYATAYQQGSAVSAYTVVDGYAVDAQSQPKAEIFLLMRSAAKKGDEPLIAVTLEELKTRTFFPDGAIAFYAEGYDATVKDYTRWLVAKSGCVSVRSVAAGNPGTMRVFTLFSGEWRSNTGALLGYGSASAVLDARLLDLRSSAPSDTMRATVTGVRAKAFSAHSIDAFQVLHPEQTRLVIVAKQHADTTREIWLSVPGIPHAGDSIAFGTVTLPEARAARTAPPRAFAMVRMLELESGLLAVREVWTSTDGYVKFAKAVQNGPLALCGAVSGTFAFNSQGTSLAQPGTSLGTSGVTTGTFNTRMTIVSPSDSLVDEVLLPPAAAPGSVPTAPYSTKGFGCL